MVKKREERRGSEREGGWRRRVNIGKVMGMKKRKGETGKEENGGRKAKGVEGKETEGERRGDKKVRQREEA